MFFQDRYVYVSRSRVVLNGVTFPINGITAVYSRTIKRGVLGLVLGIIVALTSFTCIVPGAIVMASGGAAGDNSTTGTGLGCAGVGATELFIGASLIALYIWIQKDRYALVIGTAGREVNAITHADWRYISSVVEAINQALAARA